MMIFSKKKILIIIISYFVMALVFYGVAYDQICFNDATKEIGEVSEVIGELHDGTVLEQKINLNVDYLNNVGIKVGTYGRKNSGELHLQLEDETGKLVAFKNYKNEKIADNSIVELPVRREVETGEYILKVESVKNVNDGLAVYIQPEGAEHYKYNGEEKGEALAVSINGGTRRFGFTSYLIGILLLGVILICILLKFHNDERKAKKNNVLGFIKNANRYRFLMKQLVERDFKSRYKRSVLGMFWSLLQPILMMTVQYFVFSTMFKGNIKFYPVYLLSASVMFSFFTDSVGSGLLSIVGNGNLITKVYVPKYIYPVTKVFSTVINLVLALVPLACVMLITGAPFSKAIILIPFDFLCLLMFCIGMSFVLSSLMVFFRDTQFIWSILTMVWMYATPLFYPEDIVPAQFKFVQTANPMYHYIKFFRIVLMDGMSPNLSEYVICFGFSAVILMFGIFVFKKTQDKFILYI